MSVALCETIPLQQFFSIFDPTGLAAAPVALIQHLRAELCLLSSVLVYDIVSKTM